MRDARVMHRIAARTMKGTRCTNVLRRRRNVSRLAVLPYWINFNARGIIEQVHRGTHADTLFSRENNAIMVLEFDRDKWWITVCVYVIFVKWARSRLSARGRRSKISNSGEFRFEWIGSREKWKIVDIFVKLDWKWIAEDARFFLNWIWTLIQIQRNTFSYP